MTAWTPAEQGAVRHYRRARLYGSDTDYTAAQWEAACAVFGGVCLCCGTSAAPLTVDHVVPLCKGGSNTIRNLQLLCGPCNSRKGQRIVDYRTAQQIVQLWEMCHA